MSWWIEKLLTSQMKDNMLWNIRQLYLKKIIKNLSIYLPTLSHMDWFWSNLPIQAMTGAGWIVELLTGVFTIFSSRLLIFPPKIRFLFFPPVLFQNCFAPFFSCFLQIFSLVFTFLNFFLLKPHFPLLFQSFSHNYV